MSSKTSYADLHSFIRDKKYNIKQDIIKVFEEKEYLLRVVKCRGAFLSENYIFLYKNDDKDEYYSASLEDSEKKQIIESNKIEIKYKDEDCYLIYFTTVKFENVNFEFKVEKKLSKFKLTDDITDPRELEKYIEDYKKSKEESYMFVGKAVGIECMLAGIDGTAVMAYST
jgi:hypothetical protein